jgi:hypothetical protein
MDLDVAAQLFVKLMPYGITSMVVNGLIATAIGQSDRDPVPDIGPVREKVHVVDIGKPVRGFRELECITHF